MQAFVHLPLLSASAIRFTSAIQKVLLFSTWIVLKKTLVVAVVAREHANLLQPRAWAHRSKHAMRKEHLTC